MKPEQIQFVTVPVRAYPSDPNRVEWTDDADALWKAIETDQPLPGSEPDTHGVGDTDDASGRGADRQP